MNHNDNKMEIPVIETDAYKVIQKLIEQKKHINFDIKHINKPFVVPNKSEKITNENSEKEESENYTESLLRKRSDIAFTDQDVISDNETLKKIKSKIVKKITNEENRALDFMCDYRQKVEKWKTDLILRKGKKISFNINDIESIDSRICDFHPRMDIFYKKYTEKIFVRKSCLFEVSSDQLNREIYLNSIVNSVWTVDDIIKFAEYHITEVNNGT